MTLRIVVYSRSATRRWKVGNATGAGTQAAAQIRPERLWTLPSHHSRIKYAARTSEKVNTHTQSEHRERYREKKPTGCDIFGQVKWSERKIISTSFNQGTPQRRRRSSRFSWQKLKWRWTHRAKMMMRRKTDGGIKRSIFDAVVAAVV